MTISRAIVTLATVLGSGACSWGYVPAANLFDTLCPMLVAFDTAYDAGDTDVARQRAQDLRNLMDQRERQAAASIPAFDLGEFETGLQDAAELAVAGDGTDLASTAVANCVD